MTWKSESSFWLHLGNSREDNTLKSTEYIQFEIGPFTSSIDNPDDLAIPVFFFSNWEAYTKLTLNINTLESLRTDWRFVGANSYISTNNLVRISVSNQLLNKIRYKYFKFFPIFYNILLPSSDSSHSLLLRVWKVLII